jgi:hypothetical protein
MRLPVLLHKTWGGPGLGDSAPQLTIVIWAACATKRNRVFYRSPGDFFVSFLALFAAFFSFGVMAGFFFSALMFLCSLLIVLLPADELNLQADHCSPVIRQRNIAVGRIWFIFLIIA